MHDGSSGSVAPQDLRSATPHGRTWWATLGAERISISRNEYNALVLKAEVTNNVEIRTIEKDVHRTFADRPEFRWLESRLRRVLRSYALRNTYCQGMSFIAAMLLQHMPEESAFCCLAIIVEDFLPPGYFTEELQGVYMDQHIAFDVFLPHRLPRLAAHFKALEVPTTLIGVRWFLCLFCADIEPSATAQLWDVLFSHGSHMLFAIALDLLAAAEDALLAAGDVAELFVLLRNLSRHKTSWTRLFEQAASFPSEADVAVARERYRIDKQAAEEAEHPLNLDKGDPDAGRQSEVEVRDGAGSAPDVNSSVAQVSSQPARAEAHGVPQSEMDVRAGGGLTQDVHGTAAPVAADASRPPRIDTIHTGGTPGKVAPGKGGAISLEAARAQARLAAALLLYERGAAGAMMVQSAELERLCGGEAGMLALREEMLPKADEAEHNKPPGFWEAAAPALELAGSVVGRLALWVRSTTTATGARFAGTRVVVVGPVPAVADAPGGASEVVSASSQVPA
jgi:hypothetical protein